MSPSIEKGLFSILFHSPVDPVFFTAVGASCSFWLFWGIRFLSLHMMWINGVASRETTGRPITDRFLWKNFDIFLFGLSVEFQVVFLFGFQFGI